MLSIMIWESNMSQHISLSFFFSSLIFVDYFLQLWFSSLTLLASKTICRSDFIVFCVAYELSPFVISIFIFFSSLCCFYDSSYQFFIHICYVIFVIQQRLASVVTFYLKFNEILSALTGICFLSEKPFSFSQFWSQIWHCKLRSVCTSYIIVVYDDLIFNNVGFVSNYEVNYIFDSLLGLFKVYLPPLLFW